MRSGLAGLLMLMLWAPALGQGVEADWRKQDGIGTALNPSAYSAAIGVSLQRGGALLADLQAGGVELSGLASRWGALGAEYAALAGVPDKEARWEDLWRRVHELKRAITFSHPSAKTGPILFVKQVPGSFSHQLTQVYGRYARPGGGIYVLPEPGVSSVCTQLAGDAQGSYQTPELSYDGKRVLFAYCTTDEKRKDARFYHLFSMAADGRGLRQLTFGPFDDFSPKFLPDGRIVFVSTRRGGFHRCGSPGCPVYTLSVCDADGGSIRLLSYHETQEWDPAILHDGRIIYTRWDYVDRHAVFGEQLWTTRPDGTAPSAYYGN